MPTNKFGVDLKSQGGYSEYMMLKMLRNLLRQRRYMSINESDEYDAGGKRIGNMTDPVYGSDAANKRFVEAAVWSRVHEARQTFPNGEDLNMKNRRIKNLSLPVSDDDAASKRYIDNRFLKQWSILTLIIRRETVNGYHIIDPYDAIEYEFPFFVDIKISKCDFGPDAVQIEVDNTIYSTFFEGTFHSVPKLGKLRFRSKQKEVTSNMFIELILCPTE